MIQALFSIKFQSQLRRTRPALFDALEKTIVSSAHISGGVTRNAFHCIIAGFDENAMGFWLDILSCIETFNKAMRKAAPELYGYCCVISKRESNDDDSIPLVLRSIPSDGKASGIWCETSVRRSLEYFAHFSTNSKDVSVNDELERFTELDSIRTQAQSTADDSTYAKVKSALLEDITNHCVALGPAYAGKREALRRFCSEYSRCCLPLTIHFSTVISGISSLADALSPQLRELFERHSISLDNEILLLHESLGRERLRCETSKYMLIKARRFFSLLLNAYCAAAHAEKKLPVLILENIESASEAARSSIIETYELKSAQETILFYGTCSGSALPFDFVKLFPVIIDCTNAVPRRWNADDISPSLWEIAYACKLFYRYFAPHTIIALFESQKKNRESITRTLELLHKNSIIHSLENPEPQIEGFTDGAEELLGTRCAYIKSLVKDALLNHLAEGKIISCYPVLEAIHELGGGISDELALEAIRSDIINGTYNSIQTAISSGRFNEVVGEERAPALFYCFKTLCSLLFAGEIEIRETFRMLPQPESLINIYKSQIYTIEASYKMGLHDMNAALEVIKSSMVINQNSGRRAKIAHVYRLFSLVNLSNRELKDALDYLSFAIDDAEKTKNLDELTVSSYYAANANFIFGNISKAERLIKQSHETALLSGRMEWALRTQFVLGRYYFEMGNYKSALSIFKSMIEMPSDEITQACIATLEAWIFRTELYLYECLPEKPAVFNADGNLFEIEAMYLIGEYQKTLELAEALLANLPDERFLFLEQPDWESGFSQCELVEFTHAEFWSRMCTVWRSLAACRLKHISNEEAIHTMSQIMRDERFTDYDPNAPFYFFANYRVLNESTSSEVDRSTAISMAFKRLQRRAGNIDDITTRRAFLSNQYWNKILYNTAKENKLI